MPPEHAVHVHGRDRLLLIQVIAAHVEFESKIEAKLKAIYHVLASRAYFPALSTWV
jgi:hypothetical protein